MKREIDKYGTEDELLPFLDTPEERLELMRYKGNKCRLKTTVSGPIVEAQIFPVYTDIDPTAPKKKRTPLQERAVYERRQRKHLARLINANFSEGDTWSTFEYSSKYLPKSFEDAKKIIQNYINRVLYYCKKHNLPKLKYVYTTAQNDQDGNKVRIHHHVVLNFKDRDVLERLWNHGGRPNTRKLVPDKDGLEGMARYITAQGHGKKAFCCSVGLKEPTIYEADSKLTARQAIRMMSNYAFAEEKLRKLYPQYEFISIENNICKNSGGFYIYAKMRKPFDLVEIQSQADKLSELQVKRLRAKLDNIGGTAKEIESLKRELIGARGGRIKVVKSNITRLTKSRARLLKWFDQLTKKMDRADRALLRDRYINEVGLEQLARQYYFNDKSTVFRKINKILSMAKL